jgi:ABC-type transport system involved in multi-copper enzyme maturation permease subunit
MSAAVLAELRKFRATRSVWALPVAGLAVAVSGAVLFLAVAPSGDIAGRLSEQGPLRFGPSNFGLLLVIFGVRLFGDETHHGTMASTFVRTPDRFRVLTAKATVGAVTSVVFCAAVYLVAVPVLIVGTRARDLPLDVDVAATGALFGRVVVAMALATLLGTFVGAAIRNRAAALVAALAWFALAEDLLGALLDVERFLPGAAVAGLVTNDVGPDALSAPQAALVLAATVAGAAVVATGLLRRDVT